MIAHVRKIAVVYAALLLLLALEFNTKRLLPQTDSFLVLVPAALMIVLVGFGFMELGRASGAIALFVAMGLFWLIILLGLGSLDPLTRILYSTNETANPGNSNAPGDAE